MLIKRNVANGVHIVHHGQIKVQWKSDSHRHNMKTCKTNKIRKEGKLFMIDCEVKSLRNRLNRLKFPLVSKLITIYKPGFLSVTMWDCVVII